VNILQGGTEKRRGEKKEKNVVYSSPFLKTSASPFLLVKFLKRGKEKHLEDMSPSPLKDWFLMIIYKMKTIMKKSLLDYFYSFMSEERRNKIEEKIKYRTKRLTVVLEDIYQSHNASAVLRSCECFGIQMVHIIENKNTFRTNEEVALGAHKWLNLICYGGKDKNNTKVCIRNLKKEGYHLVAMIPDRDAQPVESLPLDNKLALIFGTEEKGISDFLLKNADESATIPMVGFTQSLNLSVSAALAIYIMTLRLRALKKNWQLSEEEALEIKLNWARKHLAGHQEMEEKFIKAFLKRKQIIPSKISEKKN